MPESPNDTFLKLDDRAGALVVLWSKAGGSVYSQTAADVDLEVQNLENSRQDVLPELRKAATAVRTAHALGGFHFSC